MASEIMLLGGQLCGSYSDSHTITDGSDYCDHETAMDEAFNVN